MRREALPAGRVEAPTCHAPKAELTANLRRGKSAWKPEQRSGGSSRLEVRKFQKKGPGMDTASRRGFLRRLALGSAAVRRKPRGLVVSVSKHFKSTRMVKNIRTCYGYTPMWKVILHHSCPRQLLANLDLDRPRTVGVSPACVNSHGKPSARNLGISLAHYREPQGLR